MAVHPNLNCYCINAVDSVQEDDLSSGEEEEVEELSTDAGSIADESEGSDISPMPDEDDDADTGKPIESRKSVRFADSCGKPLTTVRVMKEPSDYPPALDPAVLRKVLGKYYKGSEDDEKPASTWVMAFTQPASDYIKFHETLNNGNVALENVVLKNEVSRMHGTIKVKNIAFEKKVFVRLSSDSWQTFTDHQATFQQSSSKTTDIFGFDFSIMSTGDDPNARIEFCICFQVGPFDDGKPCQEFWDSNGGNNYALVNNKESSPGTSSTRRYPLFGRPDKTDVYNFGCYDNWAKFASWKTVSDDAPYW
uniref:CBM21 domain-containing protein n=1 Tax=Syphacia muris TaxID=451379 RepID=A0A0N5B0W5_9BILA